MALRKEFLRFCSGTSMKGLRRIVKSDLRILRYSWLAFVCGLLAVSVSQVFFVFRDFLRFPIVTTVSEKMIQGHVFPAVTVCSNAGVSQRNTDAYGLTSISEYFSIVTEKTSCSGCSLGDQQEMDELRLQLMTTEGYMQYLGAEKSSLAALTLEEIVVDCHVSLQVGIAHIKDKCEKYFSVHVNFYSAYFNCYRYIPLPRNASDVRIVRKMSFILNVGNEHIATIFNPLAEQWHTAGAYFMVTDPREAKPAIGFDGVNIPTGMYSSLGISLLDKTSLPLPHGECIAKDEDEARAILGDCFFQSISETCGCLDVRSIMHFNLSYISSINKPFCLSMELDIETVRGNTRCSIDTSYQRGEACFNKMTERCNQKRYDKVISQAKWPAISNIPSFINFLATKPDSLRIGQVQLFNKYQQCFRNSAQNSDCDDIFQKIKYEIDNSFAEVNVEINDYHYYTMADEPKVSWAELSSQIGGILNLWSGITAVLLLELVEFLYRIVHSTVTGKDADRDKPNAAENGNSAGEKTKETSVEMRPALKSTCA